MTARVPDDRTSDVHDLLAELGELVGDLGLDEPGTAAPAAPRPAPRKRTRRARPAAPAPHPSAPVLVVADGPAEILAAAPEAHPPEANPPAHDSLAPEAHPPTTGHPSALPLDDAAELAQLAAAFSAPPGADSADLVPLWESTEVDDAEPELVPLWDAFAPELDAEPPRPWSLTAAMATVEPAAPPAPPAEPRPALLRRLAGAFGPGVFTAATVAAALVAIAVVVFTHLDLGHTTGPTTPVSKAAFEVTLMRTVDATSATAVAQAPTRSEFPSKTTQVFMDVIYRNATQGDRVRLVIELLPPAGSGGNPVPVGDQTHQLPAGGEIAVTIQGPPTGFSPGQYTVTAFHDGHLEQSLSFTVQAGTPASPSASATR